MKKLWVVAALFVVIALAGCTVSDWNKHIAPFVKQHPYLESMIKYNWVYHQSGFYTNGQFDTGKLQALVATLETHPTFATMVANGLLNVAPERFGTEKKIRLADFHTKASLVERYPDLADLIVNHPLDDSQCAALAATPELARLIRAHEIRVGMPEWAVLYSWGEPKKVNRTVTATTVHEQWVYGDYRPYAYIENGVLTAWQD